MESRREFVLETSGSSVGDGIGDRGVGLGLDLVLDSASVSSSPGTNAASEVNGPMKLVEHLRRAYRWPVPEHFEERRRASAQMVVLFATLFGIVSAGYGLFMWSVGAIQIVPIALSASVLMFVTPWIMKRSGSLSAGVHIVVFGGWVAVSAVAGLSGGLDAPVIAWLALVPAGAIFLDGARSGPIWLGISAATLVAFALLDLENVIPHEPPGDVMILRRLLSLATLVALLALMMFFHDGTHRRLLKELAQANENLERTSMEVAQKNESLASAHHELATAHAALGEAHAALGAAHARGVREAEKQRRLSLELRQAQKLEAVGRLAAGVAHELNTPLQFVSDSMSFVDESVRDLVKILERYRETIAAHVPESQRAKVLDELGRIDADSDLGFLAEKTPEALSLANQGVSRMATIVRAMKEFSYADAADTLPLDVNQAIHNTLIIAKSEYRAFADVETELGEVPHVQCRASEIAQVFLNLIVNAAHAIEERVRGTDERGLIRVRSAAVDGGVEVTVSDNGTGIPEHVRERLYDPFFTTKPVGKGTGQGLAISRHAVDRHRGRLDFTSELGRGTTFRVWLPLGPVSQANVSRPAPGSGEASYTAC